MSDTPRNSKLHLKSVYELLGEKFFIPSYQRGYRWTEIQVSELLDDLWEFSQQGSGDASDFYCLQPVVVAKEGVRWQVVDGQQRLTTLFIILQYLEKEHLRRDLNEAFKKPLYALEYETREDSAKFLKDIGPSSETKNIDFYHIARAYEVVTEWFSEKDYDDHDDFLKTLLRKPGKEKSVKAIWYDISDECQDNDYAIDVFSRINIGKIPLTNAELVKALFLKSDQFQKSQASLRQLQIASEWDSIEKRLQEPAFWHFIYHPEAKRSYETRIEFIFDLMKNKKSGAEAYFTFHQFNADFKHGGTDIDRLWKEIKDYFLTFDEWYRDRELYHLIGFLVDCGKSVAQLKKESEQKGSTKTEFKGYLKREICEQVKWQIDDLLYDDHRIKKLLLLFNIQTLLATQEADIRFPFNRYKNENWDIEHIRSQTDTPPTGVGRRDWISDVLSYFESNQNRDSSGKRYTSYMDSLRELLVQERLDGDAFNTLYFEICDDIHEGESEEWVDSLGNLALLDASTNRSYKNALFPVKRTRIIQNDMQGVFVPICTKNAFMKFYSSSSNDLLYWQQHDAESYVAAIKLVLQDYLPKQGGDDE